MDLKQFFLKEKQAVYEGTVSVLSKIPPGQIAWRPAEGMLSLGEIARHIWMSEEGTRRVALEGNWDYYDKRVPQGLFRILGEVRSVDEELGQLGRVHQETLHAVEAFPLDRWGEVREKPEFNIQRRVSVMLFGINAHHIHHRAQVGTYLHILTGKRASPYAL
jgi:uncharacterized damage-inducible protein DinB